MTRRAVLRDGPFAGDSADVEGRLPDNLRCWWSRRHREVLWVPEADSEWPSGAARYSLAESSEDPAVYVYQGVGDGCPAPEEGEREPEPKRELVPAGGVPEDDEDAAVG